MSHFTRFNHSLHLCILPPSSNKSFWDSKSVLKCKSFQIESRPNHLNYTSFWGLFQQKDVHTIMQGEVHVGEVHGKIHASLISTFPMLNNQGQKCIFYTIIICPKNSRMTYIRGRREYVTMPNKKIIFSQYLVGISLSQCFSNTPPPFSSHVCKV